MAQAVNRLSARTVQTLKAPGRHADGAGLYLVVDPSGAKRWVVLYRIANGKRREMGLGSIHSVPLADARDRAAELRRQVKAGRDPVAEKKEAGAAPRRQTFGDVATAFMAAREETWRNAAHRAQWRQTLEVQAASLWGKPVADIDTPDVLAVLEPIWQTKPETARRIRGRIEKVLDAARAQRLRDDTNPALWRGHLDMILPKNAKLSRGHHAALPYGELPDFYANLVLRDAPAARALRFIILTAARSGEVRGMVWGEVDFAAALWTVPAERMKGKRIHRVPLQAEAIEILEEIRPEKTDSGTLIFPAASGRMMSDMVFAMLLRRADRADITTHGFRSTFRDWVDSETVFAGDLAEAALAHLVGDETERAYRRGDALAKRRHLMDAWAGFVVRGAAGLPEPGTIGVAVESIRSSSS